MGRLIDADVLLKDIEKYRMKSGNVYDVIAEQPIAYDVDRVVEELEDLRSKLLHSTDYESEIINYCLSWMDDAIDKVEKWADEHPVQTNADKFAYFEGE